VEAITGREDGVPFFIDCQLRNRDGFDICYLSTVSRLFKMFQFDSHTVNKYP